MERVFRAVIAAVLMAYLISPLGMLCAAQWRSDAHSCCATTHQVSNDCCSGHVLPAPKLAPDQSRIGAAPVSFLKSTDLPIHSGSTRFAASIVLARRSALQPPPIVLRT